MTSFLNESRRRDLAATLAAQGMCQADIDHLTSIEDDLFEVDLAMSAHVLVVCQTRDQGMVEHAHLALTILQSIMAEAMERGHDEHEFPMMLHAVQDDLKTTFGMGRTLQ